jgi:hypothetical protein
MYVVDEYKTKGSMSRFYTVKGSRKIGFKTFIDKEGATYARAVQEVLAENNLAPKVYSQVGRIRRDNNNLTNWGYLTEIARMVGCGGNDCDCGKCCDIEYDLGEEIDELQASIEELGYSFYDAHAGNLGYVKRYGKKILVCIDTGEESVGQIGDDDNDEDNDYFTHCSCSHCKELRKQNG